MQDVVGINVADRGEVRFGGVTNDDRIQAHLLLHSGECYDSGPYTNSFPSKRTRMRIEVICTGDEVLTGKIVNTNFSYISQKLEDFGLSVTWETTVGDDREDLLLAFQLAGSRADAVIVNGGLGPTVDDLSQEIAAKAAGVELVLCEEWLSRMETYFARRSRVMPPNNRKQAMLPAGGEVIDNPIGTACGFAVDIGKARFYFTPGVPREMRRMLEEQVIPRLLAKSGVRPRSISSASIRTASANRTPIRCSPA